MNTKLIRFLSRVSLFKGAPQEVLEKIVKGVEVHRLPKGEVLVRQDNPSDALFIIQTGWVKVITAGKQAQEVILNQCGPGQIVGEMGLFDHRPRSNTVITISPVKILEIKYGVILQLCSEHPLLLFSFLNDLSDRLRFANTYIGETIEWCQQIAGGEYDFVEKQVADYQTTIIDLTQTHEVRANAFLSVFFKMTKEVKEREEALRHQVQQLTILIDEAQRQQDVREITESDFFKHLQTAAQELRAKRR